jgi:hypothetical protein
MSALEDFVSAATAQLELVFEPGDWIEIRCIDLSPEPAKIAHRWFQFGDVEKADAALAWAHGLNTSDEAPWNVYFGASPRRARGGTTGADVALARCVFADFDGGTTIEAALERVTAAGIPDPSFAIESGGGCHLWWRLDQAVEDLKEWQATEKATVKAVGADSTVTGKPQVMRLAGSRNVKPGRNDFLVTMRDPSLRTHPLSAFPSGEQRALTEAQTTRRPAGELADVSRAFLHRGYLPPAPGRRFALFDIACDMKGRGWEKAAAMEAIMGKLATHSNGLTAGEIGDIPRSIENAFSQPRTPGYCSAPVIGCTDEETVKAAVAAAIPAPAVAADADLPGLTFVPSGRPDGMLARVSVSRDGTLVDLAEINLGDREKREQYAVRAADLLGGEVKVAAVKAWLLRAAAQRATPAAVVQAEEAPTDAASVSSRWREQAGERLIATGFTALDHRFGGGLSPGITAICAKPGRGKSALAAQLMLGAMNADPSLRGLYFKGEMTEFLLWSRFLTTWSSIRSPAVPSIARREASKQSPTARKVDADLARIVGDRLDIVPAPLTAERMAAEIERRRPGIIVIDYLQRCSAAGFQDRRSELDHVLAIVDGLTTKYGIVTIVVSSMASNRGPGDDIGTLTKESNKLDYDAHTYMALWSEKEDRDKDPRPMRLEIVKGRTGGEGTVDLEFTGSGQFFRPAPGSEAAPVMPPAGRNTDFDAWTVEARA